MFNKLEIETSHLLLRPLNIADAKAVFKYRSNSVANKYQGWIPKTIFDVHDFIANRVSSIIDLRGTWFQLVIINKESMELIGDIGLHFIDNEKKQVEIGCTLSIEHQGKGFATEAIKATINFLFHKLNKLSVIGSVDPQNKKSIALLNRLEFKKDSRIVRSDFKNNDWPDDLIYSIHKIDWLAYTPSL